MELLALLRGSTAQVLQHLSAAPTVVVVGSSRVLLGLAHLRLGQWVRRPQVARGELAVLVTLMVVAQGMVAVALLALPALVR
jgi:hypothetical protein